MKSMIKLKFESNFDADSIMRQVKRKAFESIERQISSIYCEVHNRQPKLIVKSSSNDSKDYTVEACCDEIMNEVRKVLGLEDV